MPCQLMHKASQTLVQYGIFIVEFSRISTYLLCFMAGSKKTRSDAEFGGILSKPGYLPKVWRGLSLPRHPRQWGCALTIMRPQGPFGGCIAENWSVRSNRGLIFPHIYRERFYRVRIGMGISSPHILATRQRATRISNTYIPLYSIRSRRLYSLGSI